MTSTFLSIFEIGNSIGYWGCWAFVLIMAAGLIFTMKKYLKD